MKQIITILLLACCVLVSGQNMKKGFRSLGKLEYDKAWQEFRGILSQDKDNIGANFGMALVLADDSSAYFNVVDAWEYIERVRDRMGTMSQEEIDIISEYFLDSEVDKTSRPVKKKITNALEAIESRLIKYIREENDLEAVYEVLDRYPDFRHYDNVIHIRNQFEFRKYEKIGTIEAYEEFLKKFPDAAQVSKAEKNINRLAFEEAKVRNNVNAYTAYIARYPESEYLQTVLKMRNAAAFDEARKVNTLASYENYIQAYPDALEVSEAKAKQRDLLYEQARRIKTLQAFNEFIKKYPEGQHFIDIFNLKASELGTQFIRENKMENPSLLWARGFDNNGRIESGGSIVATTEGEYILACNTRENDSSYADAWVIKIDRDGRMKWNKTIGQAFEDSVSYVLVDSRGEIIVVGYTFLSSDSASKMGWMFKLGSDGKKLWNKNLGKIAIHSCDIDQQDKIYIGGTSDRDSLGSYYSITTFSPDARKVSEKVYTGRGTVNDLAVTDEGDLFICGSNWITLMESRRYIRWESVVDTSLRAKECAQSVSGDYYITGANKNKIFYSRYNAAGKKMWLQVYDKNNAAQDIRDILVTSDNKLMVLEQADKSLFKIKLFSPEGNIQSLKEFYGTAKPENAINTENGNIIVWSNGDLIVIRQTLADTM
jgi:hypothetical protein